MDAKTDQVRTKKELVAAMSSLVEFIEMEGEESELFGDDRVPMLDTALWVDEQTGLIMHSFFEKPTCQNGVAQRSTALSQSSI